MEKVTTESLKQWSDWHQYSFAFGQPELTAVLKQSPEDFRVDEILGFEPSGEGSHCWLLVKKRNMNTAFAAKLLSKYAGVPVKDVGYAGLKDRHAVTTQWFSVPYKKEIDWLAFEDRDMEILNVSLHQKKLARGTHRANRFVITLREATGDFRQWQARFAQICQQGLPNYFGPQRFGVKQNNLNLVDDLLQRRKRLDRSKRSIALSALRSAIFNAVCSDRVAQNSWNTVMAGDVAQLNGTQSVFKVEAVDECLQARCSAKDIHPTGPMLGRGPTMVEGHIKALETQYQKEFLDWEGLNTFRLESARRALRCTVQHPEIVALDEQTIQVKFELPRGSYATAVLRELCQVKEHENFIK